MKKYAVKLYSYQLDCNSVKAICSTKEKAFETIKKLFDILLGWLPEEAIEINYSFSDDGWRRYIDFRPKKDASMSIGIFRGVPRVQVEIYCLEFEEDALPSESVKKECFFSEEG